MPGSGRVGGFKIPPVNGKFGISTSNHEPVDGISGHESTDFAPEFLPCCHDQVMFLVDIQFQVLCDSQPFHGVTKWSILSGYSRKKTFSANSSVNRS
jgi:hypothetical protein